MTTNRKTAIITGGNSGIGFETAKELVKEGWRVVITGRNAQKLENAADKLEQLIKKGSGGEVAFRVGDFARFASVRALAADLNKEPAIDVLINNVGISVAEHQLTKDGNDLMLQVNHLSHFLLTHLLLNKLKQSAPARILNVSSRLHRLANGYGFQDFQFERSFKTLPAYGRTKLYNLAFTFELARRLKGTGVTVNALHPGIVATNIGTFSGVLALLWALSKIAQLPRFMGSRVPKYLATSPNLKGVSGKYFARGLRAIAPNKLAQNQKAARRLWTVSAKLTGIDPVTGALIQKT